MLEAAHHFGRFLGGQITAAGRVPPAKVMVIGGGVAGLAAIQTAKNMGAIVRCFDTRPEVREQVESLGGQFLMVEGEAADEFYSGAGQGGYAKQMSQAFIDAEMELFRQQCKDVDMVITTALIPGKKAPVLITKDMVESMRPGSVVVDLAAEAGGNVETTRPGEVADHNGVTCIGYTDLPSRLPGQSSRLYSNNITKFLLSLQGADDQGKKAKDRLHFDEEDEVTRGALVLREGQLKWPAPPPPSMDKVGAQAAAPAAASSPEEVVLDPEAELRKETIRYATAAAAGTGLLYMAGAGATDPQTLALLASFSLAGVAGYQAVRGVTHSLHSPLLSVTNAISGLSAVGGLCLLGGGVLPHTPGQALAALAVAVSAVNITGGFVSTQRMLDMFQRKGDPQSPDHLYAIPAAALVGLYGASLLAGMPLASQHMLLVAGLLCIGAIRSLASQETARLGNALGMIGVGTGVLATVGGLPLAANPGLLLQATALLGAGGAAGYGIARRMDVMELPQLVAGFHSLVGMAAAATSIAAYMEHGAGAHAVADAAAAAADAATQAADAAEAVIASTSASEPMDLGHRIMSYAGLATGAATATGSVVAFGKLRGNISGARWAPSYARTLNAAALGVTGLAGIAFMAGAAGPAAGLGLLGVGLLGSSYLGASITMGVGGADAPVALTVLNSASGWALAAEGFLLDNTLLTVSGSLIGFSGAILTQIMCEAMNKSVGEVILPPPPKQGSGGATAGAPAEQREAI